MSKRRVRKGLRGQSALVRSQFRESTPDREPRLKAFNVSFTNVKGPGRSHRGTYKSACVIAEDIQRAGELADRYCRKHWPKLFVEEIRLDDNLVIMA